jgi:hypothetical protein
MNRSHFVFAVAVTGMFLSFIFGIPNLMADVVITGYDAGAPKPVGIIKPDLSVPEKDKTVTLITPDGGSTKQRGSWTGNALVEIANSGQDPLPTKGRPWYVDSSRCFVVNVNSASADAGTMRMPDGGVLDQNTLYRCVNPSASVGDVCFLQGAYPTSCTAPSGMVRVAPGAELYTAFPNELDGGAANPRAVSSSGAASMTCCPIQYL